MSEEWLISKGTSQADERTSQKCIPNGLPGTKVLGVPRITPSWPPSRTASDVLLDSGEFGPYVRELLVTVDTDPPLLRTCNIKSHHLHGQKLG